MRILANKSVIEFAKENGISRQAVYIFERGERPMPMWLKLKYLKLNSKEHKKMIEIIEKEIERIESE